MCLVLSAAVKECFFKNTTLTQSGSPPNELISWFATLNSVCKELRASAVQRRSVPQDQMNQKQIWNFVAEMMKSSEPWRNMKLVVLGNGRLSLSLLFTHLLLFPPLYLLISFQLIDYIFYIRIGKTTLLNKFHKILDPLNNQLVCNKHINFKVTDIYYISKRKKIFWALLESTALPWSFFLESWMCGTLEVN